MSSQFQNRLVGTIILVAIGVIFLPDLFDGHKEHYKEQFASIPLQPTMAQQEEFKTIPEPDKVNANLPKEPVTVEVNGQGKAAVTSSDETYSIVEDTNNVEQASVVQAPSQVKPDNKQPEKSEPKVTAKAKVQQQPAASSTIAPELNKSGWMIQLGTFGNYDNADALVAKLRLNGYQAHLLPRNVQPGQYVKVIVGPDISKDKLSGKLDALKKLTGLSGKLHQFDPINP